MGLIRYRIQDESWNYYNEIDFFFQSFAVYRNDINNLIEGQLETASENYDKFLQQRVDENNFGPDDEWFEHHVAINTATNLKDIYFDSLFMVLYSFVERKLNFLCRYLEKDFLVKVDDISGKGIFKFRKYLSKVVGISFDPIEEQWKELEKLNQLRNFLVHSSGSRSVPKTNQSLISILKQFQGVHLEEQGENIRFNFVTDHGTGHFVHIVRSIIDYLYQVQ